MKETRLRRTGADHEHVEKISARAAMLLVAVAAVLLHLLQWIPAVTEKVERLVQIILTPVRILAVEAEYRQNSESG
jgi:hypothetical protein